MTNFCVIIWATASGVAKLPGRKRFSLDARTTGCLLYTSYDSNVILGVEVPKSCATSTHKITLLSYGIAMVSKLSTPIFSQKMCIRDRVKAGTHSAFGERSHTAAYTPKQGLFRTGVVSLPSERSARSQTSPGRVSERCTLPLLRLDPVCSRRTQKAFGTAMRLCASLFRGVAAPLGCVICLQLADVAVFSLCAQYFLNVRGGGGITTLGAFHTVRKPCVARYQNGKLCRFWGLMNRDSFYPAIACFPLLLMLAGCAPVSYTHL